MSREFPKPWVYSRDDAEFDEREQEIIRRPLTKAEERAAALEDAARQRRTDRAREQTRARGPEDTGAVVPTVIGPHPPEMADAQKNPPAPYRAALTPHQHTVALGQRHLVRIGRAVLDGGARLEALMALLDNRQTDCVRAALDDMESRLLDKGFAVE
jgi:hypothetical protein